MHPADAVVGRWGSNASCVVVGPNYVLTTTHQGWSNWVQIGGKNYQTHAVPGMKGGFNGAEDIQLAWITDGENPANLASWVGLSAGGEAGKRFVIGGYGRARGATLLTSMDIPYGYGWSSGGNTTLRWGENTIPNGNYITQLIANFDDFGTGDAVPVYEAAVAEWDSGGGWFIQEGGAWKVAGLSISAEHADISQTWYRNSFTGSLDPDRLTAIRVFPKAGWINFFLDDPIPVTGDADRNGVVDIVDLGTMANYYGTTSGADWSMGDFNADRKVDITDLGMLANHYGDYGYATGQAGGFAADLARYPGIPEPCTLGLLGAGVLTLLARRPRRRPTV